MLVTEWTTAKRVGKFGVLVTEYNLGKVNCVVLMYQLVKVYRRRRVRVILYRFKQ
jgi:hypothetical protein